MPSPREFAAWAHAGQTYGDHPYLVHLVEVVEIAAAFYDDIVDRETLEAVGYLHDVIEDTFVTRLFLDQLFGGITAKAVALLSDPFLPTRRERKQALHRRLRHLEEGDRASRAALIVKASDRLANVRACVRDKNLDLRRMYSREHVEFREAVRRPGLCVTLWEELDSHLT